MLSRILDLHIHLHGATSVLGGVACPSRDLDAESGAMELMS
jgi:hypothetical protein